MSGSEGKLTGLFNQRNDDKCPNKERQREGQELINYSFTSWLNSKKKSKNQNINPGNSLRESVKSLAY